MYFFLRNVLLRLVMYFFMYIINIIKQNNGDKKMKSRFNKQTRNIEYLINNKIWLNGFTIQRLIDERKIKASDLKC